MNFVSSEMHDEGTRVAIVDDHASLATFVRPECPAAIWHRQTPSHIQDWLDGLAPELLPQGRVILPSGDIADALDQLFEASGLPAGTGRDWLHADITS